MSGCCSLPDRSGIVFCGQHESSDAQISAKVADLIVYGFEIQEIEMPKDKIQNRQFSAHVLDGMFGAGAKIFPANGSVDQVRKQVIDTTVSEKNTSRGMTFSQDLLGERHAFLPLLARVKVRYWRAEKYPECMATMYRNLASSWV